MWGVDSLSFHNSNEVYRYQRIDASQVRPMFYSGCLWIMCRAFEWTIASKYTRQKEWSLFDIVVPNRCHGDSFDCDRIWQRSLRLSSGLNKRTAVWIRKQLHTFLPISFLFSSKWMIMIWIKKKCWSNSTFCLRQVWIMSVRVGLPATLLLLCDLIGTINQLELIGVFCR